MKTHFASIRGNFSAGDSFKLARQVLYVGHGHCIFVDQCELESDSRFDVTSNDVSVK